MPIARDLEAPLRRAAKQMPVVAVTGPRQSGKTTLCRAVFPDRPYVSLEALDNREFAETDPRGFLTAYRGGAILDEIQRAPGLLSYLQVEVDEDPRPGRFVVTGSQHFGLTEAVTQSLAGRIALLHLLPPSLDELMRFEHPATEQLWRLLWTGSYPRIYDRRLDADRWLADYTATYLQRDVRQVLNVSDLEAFTTFLRLAAARTAREVNLSALGGDAGVSHNTARSWLSVLEASFIAVRLPAWTTSRRKRLVKAPKLHFLDTGLVCHLLGITKPDQLLLHPLRGAIFESWVAGEIFKARLHRGAQPDLFHYRETRGLEVDLIIDSGDRLTAVEAKSGATVAGDFLRPLALLREVLTERTPQLEVDARLVYGGETRQDRTTASVLPWREIQSVDW
ncbi:MAG: ATP-binding protein [Thermoanaerobaculia bacterium]